MPGEIEGLARTGVRPGPPWGKISKACIIRTVFYVFFCVFGGLGGRGRRRGRGGGRGAMVAGGGERGGWGVGGRGRVCPGMSSEYNERATCNFPAAPSRTRLLSGLLGPPKVVTSTVVNFRQHR
jgi:hypothetical protein